MEHHGEPPTAPVPREVALRWAHGCSRKGDERYLRGHAGAELAAAAEPVEVR